jgi:hypothetical protein
MTAATKVDSGAPNGLAISSSDQSLYFGGARFGRIDEAAKDVVARVGRIDRCIQKVTRGPMRRGRWRSSTRERC